MNRIGMLVDLSHVSVDDHERRARCRGRAGDLLALVGFRRHAAPDRNVPDQVLERLPENGGVVMVTFVAYYVSVNTSTSTATARGRRCNAICGVACDAGDADRDEINRHGSTSCAKRQRRGNGRDARRAGRRSHRPHARTRSWASTYIGIGSDFDGTSSSVPVGSRGRHEDARTCIAELLRRGYSDDEVKKILGGNVLRAMREAESVAARLQRERPASEALIDDLDGAPVER